MMAVNNERGSVRFNLVGKTEFFFTPTNRIFLQHEGKIITPRLIGSSFVKYDDKNFEPTPAVAEAVLRVLKKQHEIRFFWPSYEEDEIAFQYN
jgi:hypothetical protein